ncbi:MAG: histidine kinase [Spirochaeta sp.]|jgi:two-component system sensor histidine kinase YesM|nr:histidine kinase [Spirochaeta sp.]
MRVRNSLRGQLIYSAVIGLAMVIVTIIYILFATVRMQQIVNDQFQVERDFQELQQEVVAIRTPLLNYLSSRSSQALAQLLVEEQVLRSMVPENLELTSDPVALSKREIYSLLQSYLDLIQRTIDLKRARAIEEYTELYDEMVRLNDHIVERIDQISLAGLRGELARYEEIIETSRELLFWNLAVIILAFFGSTLWILISINRITDPMNQLAAMAGEISGGNFEVEDIKVNTVHEMAAVISAFNTMKHDIRQYIGELNQQQQIEQGYMQERVRNLKMEQLLKRMELYTMQAQMNPHFLFNTLNTGVQLAITEDAEKTADFMEHLAQFFRYNMRERNLLVPLRREIEGLEAYVYILRIRFPRSLEFSMDVPEDLMDACTVPALMLQPLVENSVIHAFKGVDRAGRIAVRIWKEGSIVYLTVRDNGIGIDPNIAQRLLQRHSRDEEQDSKVMGLENVIQRLYFIFPDQYDVISITGDPGTGTEIRIRIDTEVTPSIPS